MVLLNDPAPPCTRLHRRLQEVEKVEFDGRRARQEAPDGGGRHYGDAIWVSDGISAVQVPEDGEVCCDLPGSSFAPTPPAVATTPQSPHTDLDGSDQRHRDGHQWTLAIPAVAGNRDVHDPPSLGQVTLALQLGWVDLVVGRGDVRPDLGVANWSMGIAVMLFTVVGGALVYLKSQTPADDSYTSPLQELVVAAAYSMGYLSLAMGLLLALYIVFNPRPTPETDANTRALVCVGLVWVTVTLLVQIVIAQPKRSWPPVIGFTVLGTFLTIVAVFLLRLHLQGSS